MPKYKITNVSSESSKGARSVFVIDAGKLLKPGDSCTVSRLNSGTKRMGEAGLLKIEEGSFDKAPVFAKEPLAPKAKPGPSAAEAKAKAAEEAAAMQQRLEEKAARERAEAEAAKKVADAAAEVAEAEQAEAEQAEAAVVESASDAAPAEDPPKIVDESGWTAPTDDGGSKKKSKKRRGWKS